MTPLSYENYFHLTEEIQRRCKENNIALLISKEIEVPCASRNQITFPLLAINKPVDLKKLKAAIIHEPLHVLRPDSYDIADKYKLYDNQALFFIMNVLEDCTMERIHCAKYEGDKQELTEFYNWINLKNSISILNILKDKIDEETERKITIMILASKIRSDWDSECPWFYTSTMEASVTKEIKEYLNQFELNNIYDKATKCITPRDSYLLSIEIYNILYPNDQQKPDTEVKKTQQQEENTGEDKSNKESEGENISNSSKKIPWKDVVNSEHRHGYIPIKNDGEAGIDWLGIEDNKDIYWTPFPFSSHELRSSTGHNLRSFLYNTNLTEAEVNNFTNYYCRTNKEFSEKVRRLLLIDKRTNIIKEKLSGKLNVNSLNRLVYPVLTEYNNRIFKSVKYKKDLDTTISILVDWSGSMCVDNKKVYAAASVALLNDLFSISLRIPLEIIAFTTSAYSPIESIVVEYKERIQYKELFTRLANFSQYSDSNADGDSILFALNRIKYRREKRKIIIVLSDGSPSMSNNLRGYGSSYSGLRQAIAITKKERMEIYGIGIRDDNVKRFYDNCEVITDLNTLQTTLVNILYKYLHRDK